jgi:hypothetical protein
MNKTLLFIIHGMGVHDQGWEVDLKTKLTDLTTRYPGFQNANLWDHVELIPIRYDNHIVEALNQWQAQAGAVSVFAEANKLGGSESLAWRDLDGNNKFDEDPSVFMSVDAFRLLQSEGPKFRAEYEKARAYLD